MGTLVHGFLWIVRTVHEDRALDAIRIRRGELGGDECAGRLAKRGCTVDAEGIHDRNRTMRIACVLAQSASMSSIMSAEDCWLMWLSTTARESAAPPRR